MLTGLLAYGALLHAPSLRPQPVSRRTVARAPVAAMEIARRSTRDEAIISLSSVQQPDAEVALRLEPSTAGILNHARLRRHATSVARPLVLLTLGSSATVAVRPKPERFLQHRGRLSLPAA